MLQQTETSAAHALERPLALLVVAEVLLVLLVQRLLLAACSGRAEAEGVVAQAGREAQVVQVVVALVAAVARVAAAHTQQVLVASVAMAGHWYWSFDHAAICRG